MLLGVLADDLTGALDTGAQFRLAGLSTRVLLSPAEAVPSEADVAVRQDAAVSLFWSQEPGAGAEESPAVAEALAGYPLAGVAAKSHAEAPFDAWIVTGGETARRLLQALGASGITLLGEAAPGMPLSRVEGGSAAGAFLVTKAGGFGGPDALALLADRLRGQDS